MEDFQMLGGRDDGEPRQVGLISRAALWDAEGVSQGSECKDMYYYYKQGKEVRQEVQLMI